MLPEVFLTGRKHGFSPTWERVSGENRNPLHLMRVAQVFADFTQGVRDKGYDPDWYSAALLCVGTLVAGGNLSDNTSVTRSDTCKDHVQENSFDVGTRVCFDPALRGIILSLESTQITKRRVQRLTWEALSESGLDDGKSQPCPILIPISLIKRCLELHFAKFPPMDWHSRNFTHHAIKTITLPDILTITQEQHIHDLSVHDFARIRPGIEQGKDELNLLLQLILCALCRSLPIIYDDKLARVAHELGFAYFRPTFDSFKFCASRGQTQVSDVHGQLQDDGCIQTESLVYDTGLADANFDRALESFSLDRWSMGCLDSRDEIKVFAKAGILQVSCYEGRSQINVGDAIGPVITNFILSTRNVSHIRSQVVPRHGQLAVVGSTVHMFAADPNTILWGVGIIDPNLFGQPGPGVTVSAVRGPRTRDIFILKHNLNPLVISDPALITRDVFPEDVLMVDNIRHSARREVCFWIHEVDRSDVIDKCPLCTKYLVDHLERDFSLIFKHLVNCKRVVSSSLHGVIFSHSFSIPSIAIRISNKIVGEDFKFIDYMHSIKVHSFRGRIRAENLVGQNLSVAEWIKLVDESTQPEFPISTRHFFEVFPVIE